MFEATAETTTVHVTMDQNLLSKLGLDADAKGWDEKRFGELKGRKINALLKAATNVAEANFPLLTRDAWICILTALQPGHPADLGKTLHRLTSVSGGNELAGKICDEFRPGEYDAKVLDVVSDLPSAALLCVYLVAEFFWSQSGVHEDSMRKALSQISGRPEESVYRDDPSIDDLWKTNDVSWTNESQLKVRWNFADSPMAEMVFTVSPNLNSWTVTRLDCNEGRTLAPPGLSLTRYLASRCHDVVCAFIDEKKRQSRMKKMAEGNAA